MTLFEKYRDQGFMVLAFPCDQFGKQELGSMEEILKFTQEKFGVNFPIFNKIHANGSDVSPLFEFLKKCKVCENSICFKHCSDFPP